MKQIKLMQGDNILSLKKLPENSIDSIVTDPPYGLSFMNKKWDYDVPSVEFWKEVYRVLKPGGHVLSFGGTRTYHRMVVNMEDAGFEIRDQIMWLYGSGFPKSLNIGKAVDKLQGNKREVIGERDLGYKDKEKSPYSVDAGYNSNSLKGVFDITKGNSEWEGWGTALKPANEPICLARKPLSEKNIVDNVIKWGTGGINVDGCRIGSETITSKPGMKPGSFQGVDSNSEKQNHLEHSYEGRFPANILFDETAAEMLDKQSGILIQSYATDKSTGGWSEGLVLNNTKKTKSYKGPNGGASRFFYVAKVSKKERNLGLDGFDVEINIGTIKLLIYKRKNEIIWEKQDQKAKHQVDMEQSIQKVIEEYGLQTKMGKEEWQWSTELFGNYIMDQFQKECKSTILMETNLTTIYQTLNAFIQQSTKEYIAMLLKEKMVGIKFVEDVEKKNTKVYITSVKEDGLVQNVSNAPLIELLYLNVKENKCSHPTLKPINLMTYLCRMITPPGGIVLDPFMGSGSTGIAARLEGFRFVGMELDEDYFKIAEARINSYEEYRKLLK